MSETDFKPVAEDLTTLLEMPSLLSAAELARRAADAQRLKEDLSHVPFYARRAALLGESYWRSLLASEVNRYRR